MTAGCPFRAQINGIGRIRPGQIEPILPDQSVGKSLDQARRRASATAPPEHDDV